MKRPTYKCGQANAFFILSPRAASQLNLVQFLQAEKYEYSTASCASKQFTSLWNKAVDKGHSVVFIDYPVTEEVDVKTVKKFLLHTTTEEGAWYYSPRPNSFLVVEDAFMLGVKHPKRISGINKLAMRSLLQGYQANCIVYSTGTGSSGARRVFAKMERPWISPGNILRVDGT